MIKDYVKSCGNIYVFPVGFIEAHNVLTDLLEKYPTWCRTVVGVNKTEPVGISWNRGENFTYWRYKELSSSSRTKIWVNNQPCVLGGL